MRNVYPEYLRRCIHSIEQARAKSRAIKTTLVISEDCSENSFSGEYRRLALAHRAEYVRSERWCGIGGARNLGAAHIGSEATHVMFVDADDEIDEACISSMAISGFAETIVTGFCRVIGRGRSHITEKVDLLKLVESCHGLRSSPLLYTNVVGQPALLPMAAFEAVNGYVERQYSGEHVDLWGRLVLGGKVRSIVLVPKVLYCYYSSAAGNYRRDELRHRRGVAEALSRLATAWFNDVCDYTWAASGQSLPSLYVPIESSGSFRLPPWAECRDGRWWLKTANTGQCKVINICSLYFNLRTQSEVDR
ncbi:MAG: glycosyltransferase family 2 protein [Pseudonocardiaceae bacterium]